MTDEPRKGAHKAKKNTRHQEAENALRESERRYRELFENIRSGAAVYEVVDDGKDFVFRDFNRAGCEIEGVSREDVIGKKLTEVFPGVGDFGVLAVLQRVWKSGVAEHVPATFYEDERISGWRENYIYKLPSGEVVAIYNDVTEQKEASLTLEAKERYFRSLLYSLHEDILVIGRDRRIADTNSAILITTGQKREDVIGRHCYKILQGMDKPCYGESDECGFEYVFRTGKPCGRYHKYIRADDSTIDMDLLLSPMMDVDGNITHVIAAMRNVSDLLRTRDALRESEAKYRLLFENSPSGIAYLDTMARVLMMNDAGAAILGGKPEEYLGKFVIECLPSQMANVVDERVKRVIRTRSANQYETEFTTSTGRVWLSSTYSPAINAKGEIVGVQIVAADITERKRLEEQLLQSQKMEAIGHLAGGVAHDFRNQLTVIRGFAEMLVRQGLVRNDGKDKIAEILKAVDRSTNLTSQLLSLGRRDLLQPQVISVTGLIADLSKFLPQMIRENIRLSIVSGASDCRASIDPDQFQQAIINLVINARDAMPSGGKLVIETECDWPSDNFYHRHPDLKPRRYVRVRVIDTGVGMDPQTRKRIFEPFFTTKETGQGTGLGLSMTYGFVKQSGGAIECDSTPGKGTEFRLYFPCVDDPVDAECSCDQRAEKLRGTETLLIVEDEQSVRNLLAAMLESAGYTVIATANAEEALAQSDAHKGHIDMLITDVVMPGMTGAELAGMIVQARPDIGVLYITGYAGKDLSLHGVDEGAVNLLIKPLTRDRLMEKIREVLDGRDG